MFKNTKAFGGFSVINKLTAKKFYSDLLGIEISENEMGILELHISGSNPFMVYEKPDHTPATFTILNFPVENMESVVDELIAKGITFEQYDGAIKTNEKGIHSHSDNGKVAWFKDPSGNILSLVQI